MRRGLLVVFLALAYAPSARAQQVRTALVPDSITVGDVVRAAVRVSAPLNATVVLPDSMPLPIEVENAGKRVLTIDTTADGIEVTAQYQIAAWRPGAHALLPIPFTVNGVAYTATFDSLRIRSVLPADTTGIQPKPLKAVLGATRVWWPWIVAAILLLAIAAVAWWLYLKRRRPAAEAAAPVVTIPPRELALGLLDRALAAGLVARGDFKQFYSEVTDALRGYAAAIDPALSQDLTTSEVAALLRRRGAEPAGIELLTLLGAADLVKFAKREPRSGDSMAEWTRARRWVAEVTWPPVTILNDTERVA